MPRGARPDADPQTKQAAKERIRARKPPHPEQVLALACTLNVEVMLDRVEERGLTLPDTIRMQTARTLQLAWDENSSIIARKQRAFVWACVALLAQATSWITLIALGREVI